MTKKPSSEARAIAKTFPFRYVGGGYYRDKDVEKGEPAPVLHGDEVIAAVVQHVLDQRRSEENP